MRLLLGCAGILILLASGATAAATGLANSPRFEELICPADAAASYPVADAVICENGGLVICIYPVTRSAFRGEHSAGSRCGESAEAGGLDPAFRSASGGTAGT